jgi:hypothetical protein
MKLFGAVSGLRVLTANTLWRLGQGFVKASRQLYLCRWAGHKKSSFKRGVRGSEAFRHLLAEGRIFTEFLN